MKFGLYLDLRNPGGAVSWSSFYSLALDTCERGEALGADSVWLSEHHGFADGYLPQPLIFAAAIAARTSRIRIGTAVLLASLRNPVHLVEEAAVVDLLSDGRLILGLGGGYRAAEFELFGIENEGSSLTGLFLKHQQIRELLQERRVSPMPAQHPLDLWLGCNGPIGARRVGRLGEPLLSVRVELWPSYRTGLVEGGHDPTAARMSGPVNIFLTEDPARDAGVVANAFGYLWDSYAAANVEGTGEPLPPPVDTDLALKRGLAGGLRGLVVARPEDAADLLVEHFSGIPVDTLFSWSLIPGVPRDLMDRHVELWSATLPGLVAARTGA